MTFAEITKEQYDNAKASKHRRHQRTKERVEQPRFDWDRAIAGLHLIFDEIERAGS